MTLTGGEDPALDFGTVEETWKVLVSGLDVIFESREGLNRHKYMGMVTHVALPTCITKSELTPALYRAVINLCSRSGLSAAAQEYSSKSAYRIPALLHRLSCVHLPLSADLHIKSRPIEATIYHALVCYLQDKLSRIRAKLAGTSEMTLLTYYSQEWDRYTQSARVLNNIFSYINRREQRMTKLLKLNMKADNCSTIRRLCSY